MPIDRNALGATRSATNVITPRWVLAYASALGLSSESYLDDSRPSTLIIPPTFCVCLEWTLSDMERGVSSLGLRADEQRGSVHALQDSRFERPLKLGMRVRTDSRVEYIGRTSAGAYVLTSFRHTDDETGDRLITSYSGAILRGVDFADAPLGELPSDLADESASGLAQVSLPALQLERTLPHIYSECARIWNPIHTETAVARAVGLDDIIVHGTLTWALAAREICRSVDASDLGRLGRLSAQFRAPLVAGRTMTIRPNEIQANGQLRFSAVNEQGRTILANGLLEILH
ncbi:FAS1-like dehydratase domain-containing protein [Rhodopseudomonas pseudopalustris]|uniref:MaoC like domain-containing protein n=1 Tax=Rhodopseudomonas pseudopalustris TaxID=1513892 RepID=A0A1H8W8I0_9BRAD|nr:MaoC family dehydratase N-terminal domain-containing protein [Rhodopseudomonas pseudopalustris]MBB1091544.1 MaoC family dehydratase N-terminal domain-containing protein [Rhodopseudomonas palustris]SEP23823.1 MaoC like domain-containing protein [Rhodopseudomonas pseudopalustris]